jgi:hypothetical protein
MYVNSCFSVRELSVANGDVSIRTLNISLDNQHDLDNVCDFLNELFGTQPTKVHRSYTHWQNVDYETMWGYIELLDGNHYDIENAYVKMVVVEDAIRFFVGNLEQMESFDVEIGSDIVIDFESRICRIDLCEYATYDDDDYYEIALPVE